MLQGKEEAAKENSDTYDAAEKKGVSKFEASEGYKKDNEQKYESNKDGGKYDEESGKKQEHTDEGSYADKKYHQQGGETLADYGKKEAHKKGHHHSGFRNSYHKDETGSNSSFFDDAEDQGDQLMRHQSRGQYGGCTSYVIGF